MARKKKFSKALTLFLAVVCLAAGCLIGYLGGAMYGAMSFKSDEAPKALVEGELQIHFLELGNKYTGDCTYIKAGETDILIDAGSKTSSIATISEYIDQYVTDDKLEYVIVTHAHEDHYAGFDTFEDTDSLFDLFTFETIIDFAQIQDGKEDKTMYKNYVRERDAEVAAGAKHYTADECVGETYLLGSGVEMEILDSDFYYHNESDGDNNHSVCTHYFFHVVRNQNYSYFFFSAQFFYCLQNLFSANRVKHSRWFIQHDALWAHRNHSCNGNTLFLSAR